MSIKMTVHEPVVQMAVKADEVQITVSSAGAGGADSAAALRTAVEGGETLVSAIPKAVRPYAFYKDETLACAELPNVREIGKYAFSGCSVLRDAFFSSAEAVGEYAFSDCPELPELDFPRVTIFGLRAFDGDSLLSEVTAPLTEEIGEYAFYNCEKLTGANYPKVTTIRRYVFYAPCISHRLPRIITGSCPAWRRDTRAAPIPAVQDDIRSRGRSRSSRRTSEKGRISLMAMLRPAIRNGIRQTESTRTDIHTNG